MSVCLSVNNKKRQVSKEDNKQKQTLRQSKQKRIKDDNISKHLACSQHQRLIEKSFRLFDRRGQFADFSCRGKLRPLSTPILAESRIL